MQTILERMENNMLKWYGHVVRMKDSRWPKRIMTWSSGGRRRRGRPEAVGEKKGREGYEGEELNIRRRRKPTIMATENQ
jgi:hypothetical protein